METRKRTSRYHTNKCCFLPPDTREALTLQLRSGDLTPRSAVSWLEERGYSISKSTIQRWKMDRYPLPPELPVGRATPKSGRRPMRYKSDHHTNACYKLPRDIQDQLASHLQQGMTVREAEQWLNTRGHKIGKSIIGRWHQDGCPVPHP